MAEYRQYSKLPLKRQPEPTLPVIPAKAGTQSIKILIKAVYGVAGATKDILGPSFRWDDKKKRARLPSFFNLG